MTDVRICLQMDTSTSPDDRILHSRSRRGRPARRRLLSNDGRTYKFIHQPRHRRYSIFPGLTGRKFQRQREWVHHYIEFWNLPSSLQSTAHYTAAPTSHPLSGCKTSTASSTSATRTKSVSYGRYLPVSTSLRVTRNAPITTNLT